VPDFAAARDTPGPLWKRRLYGIFALGFSGASASWRHWRASYFLLAGLATPLVLSVHSVVSLDFATAKVPGWHSTIFPPYFVAGAIFSGFAMVVTLLVPVRRLYGLHDLVTTRHLDAIGKMILLTGSIVGYSYIVEHITAWWSGSKYESFTFFVARPFGPYGFIFWLMVAMNVVLPQVLWSRRLRRSSVALWVISIGINIGMWTERFNIIAGSLAREYTPSSWALFFPTVVDGGIFLGTLCFFLFMFLLFLRLVPFVPVSEIKELAHELGHEHPEVGHG
jgi:molybdopterin-containing oxidoreductase family membrane subunit